MRAFLAVSLALTLAACGGTNPGDDSGGGDAGDGTGPDACVGLECQLVDCGAMGQPLTTLTGTVFAPNGTLPLNGVNVYVPREPLPAFTDGVACERCASQLPGGPIAQATTDAAGNFRLTNVPAGADIPLVITTGKWRRQVTLPSVTQCAETAVGAADTRLPRNQAEGEIPKIAITTGNADSMECLARKLGIDDAEITTSAGAGRIHLYAGNGVNRFKSGFPGGSGETFSAAQAFWDSLDSLKAYDIVILSCEGSQRPETKSQAALDNMKAYADAGGRVFASHWHNIWVGGAWAVSGANQAPPVWDTIAVWENRGSFNGIDHIDEVANPKGPAFADWMLNVMGSTVRGEFPVTQGRVTVDSIDTARAELWVTSPPDEGSRPQMFQFTTPNEVANDQRCGKVVFTDMHVSGSRQSGDYPDSCVGGEGNLALTPQEKALAFMFFDIASCVGGIF